MVHVINRFHARKIPSVNHNSSNIYNQNLHANTLPAHTWMQNKNTLQLKQQHNINYMNLARPSVNSSKTLSRVTT